MKPYLLLLALLMMGCAEVEYSEPLWENAVIDDLVFMPRQHGSGPSVGVTSGGNVAVGTTTITIPEKFAIVFKCAHGKFIIQGSGEKYRGLWQRFSSGDSVIVVYREVREDGRLVDYDFLDAQKVSP